MSVGRLKLETARGAMRLLSSSTNEQLFEMFGLTEEELNLVLGSQVWIGANRQTVRKCLDALCAGVMDAISVPRFEMPAEYIAAVIASFVHPTNIMVACRWMENQRAAESLWGSSPAEADIKPAAVFALVCTMLDDEGCRSMRTQFEKRVNKALKFATEKGGEK